MTKLSYTDANIKAMIKGIEDGRITELKLPLDYYEALVKYLSKAVFEGFGANLKTVSSLDLDLLEELVTNVYTFGAAKTFQQTSEISSLLVDDEGKVRSSQEFNELARKTYDNWNDNWGRTEYTTAVGQANSASKWAEIERQKDILPSLRYDAVLDPNTSDICAPLDGIVAPVDDPIWDKIMPLNHFNCRCVVLQTDEDTTNGNSKIVNGVTDEMQDLFINNSGKTGTIFNKDHPYFDVAKEYKEFALENFGLPIQNFKED
jgi:SPP1 gp7 family putative phage head morphogenesis protein